MSSINGFRSPAFNPTQLQPPTFAGARKPIGTAHAASKASTNKFIDFGICSIPLLACCSLPLILGGLLVFKLLKGAAGAVGKVKNLGQKA